MVPKMAPYLGLNDPECHVKAFRTQMLISEGSDRYKIFVDTFTGVVTMVQWNPGWHHKCFLKARHCRKNDEVVIGVI